MRSPSKIKAGGCESCHFQHAPRKISQHLLLYNNTKQTQLLLMISNPNKQSYPISNLPYQQFTQIKMKLSRIKSSQSIMPLRHEDLLQQQQHLRQKTRQLLSRPNSQTTFRKISTALFTSTSRSNAFFKSQSIQRNQQTPQAYLHGPQSSAELRPLTQSTSRCHRAYSPLSIIRTRSKCQSLKQSVNFFRSSQKLRKSNFLRKGSAIDKAVISNILKSKLNKNVCAPTFGYCDLPQNRELVSIISRQIPQGIRDVVGAEEMVRMSHIFTGTQFRCISLTKRINQAINDAHLKVKNRKSSEDEQSITLKSIKRW